MRNILCKSMLAIGLMAAVGGAAQATTLETVLQRSGGDAVVGMGMICDSQAQAARFLELRAQGRKADAAMAAVNRESPNKKACGLAVIAFKPDATLASKSVDNKLVQVVRIDVVAGFTGKTWQQTANFVQYAVVEADGIEV